MKELPKPIGPLYEEKKELRPARDFSPCMLLYGALPLFRTKFPRCHALLSFVTSSLASPIVKKKWHQAKTGSMIVTNEICSPSQSRNPITHATQWHQHTRIHFSAQFFKYLCRKNVFIVLLEKGKESSKPEQEHRDQKTSQRNHAQAVLDDTRARAHAHTLTLTSACTEHNSYTAWKRGDKKERDCPKRMHQIAVDASLVLFCERQQGHSKQTTATLTKRTMLSCLLLRAWRKWAKKKGLLWQDRLG